jgi:hypothetical protein
MKNTELKKIFIDRDGAYCEICVFPKSPLDLHHCLIGDRKKWHDILTVEENCVLVCRDCHPYANSHEFRMSVLKHKIEPEDGLDRMRKFWKTVPDKLKRHIDYFWIGEELQ